MLNVLRIWILFSTLLVSAGWILSALHELNPAGYCVVFVLAAIACIVWQRRTGLHRSKDFPQLWRKFRNRFRRPAPLIFLALAVMSLVAGVLYRSDNNDSDEYRIPRVWHWLSEGHWHWIHTADTRMNVAACNYEWLYTPLMLFTRNDRFLFFANWISYLLLPGLVFSVFTRLGIRSRVAWWWMWLLASGWCYVTQAASDANDSIGAIYALASVDLALRAREKRHLPDLWLSMLALALMTGVKQTNLPLVLPGLAAIVLCFPMLMRRPLATVGIGLAALLVSAAPILCLTFHYTGKWLVYSITLGSQTYAWGGYNIPPFWGFIGNIFCLTVQNLHPPFFPWANRWNNAMEHFVQTPFGSHFKSFESFGRLGEGSEEANSGIGLWIFLLAGISICAARYYRKTEPPTPRHNLGWLRWLPFISLVAFMARDGTFQSARQMASYYTLLFPALLVARGQSIVVRKRWWQVLVVLSMVVTAAFLVVARNRPLFPAKTILQPLVERHPRWHFLARVWLSYSCRFSVEQQRNAFKNEIPPDEHVIGFATIRGSQEPGKWVPYGSLKVDRVLPIDTPAELEAKHIHYVLADDQLPIGFWTNQLDGVVLDKEAFEGMPGVTNFDYWIRLNSPSEK